MSRASDRGTRSVVDWGAGERRRRRLEAELQRIVSQLPGLGVRRAILFGSLARGDVRGQSDLDLILIADSGEPFFERGARFYRALVPAVAMDLLVYTPEEFEAMRDRGFVRRALAQAENGLAFAELATRESYFAQACFNSQQAAEKILKAFLYARGAEQVLGRSVAELAAECAKLDTEFMALRAQAAPLDQFYLPTRYPNSLPGGIPAETFARADGERALAMARAVIAGVKRRFP